jgi:endonuclease/exonuclease/phosphatase family metal-dependent hydrolase
VTIWSRFRQLALVPVHDTGRTVAALYETPFGPLVVYATVLPWHADTGPSANARNWTEQHRIVPEQADEWAAMRQRYPAAALCVAGDMNMNLGGPHYYGTKVGRDLLERGLEEAGLACVTRTEHVPHGRLQLPHIDHVCLSESWAPGARVVEAWPGTMEGVELSDHSGLVVAVEQPAT